MAYGRGVKGVTKMAVGQIHIPEETAQLLVQAVNRCYPQQSNGSLKSSMELVIHDFLEIPVNLSPEDMDSLMKITESSSICEALAKVGVEYLTKAGGK